MENRDLFQTLQEIYESFSTAGAIPSDMSGLGCRIQTGGNGNPEYPLTVVCCFRSYAGEDWQDFCLIYSGEPLCDRLMSIAKGRLRVFWGKVNKRRAEFESLARYYL